jgi:hypothetical protein
VQVVRLFVEIEAVDAVGIGELAERAELVGGEARLQLVGCGHQCHARHYSKGLPRGVLR